MYVYIYIYIYIYVYTDIIPRSSSCLGFALQGEGSTETKFAVSAGLRYEPSTPGISWCSGCCVQGVKWTVSRNAKSAPASRPAACRSRYWRVWAGPGCPTPET